MSGPKFELVEEDAEARDELLSFIMVRHLMQGVAYFCMVESGRPMSPADMTAFLGVSDSWYTQKFEEAVQELVKKGLVREVH